METTLVQPAIAVLLSSAIAIRAFKRNSLNLSGAFLGFIVMFIHIAVNYRLGAMLLVFFFTSSKLTKVGVERKRSIDADFKEGGQRNWIQVLSNSGIATLLVLIAWMMTRSQDKCLDSKESQLLTSLIGGVIGHYSCSMGTHGRQSLGYLPVRRGTNGGVTKAGLLAAAAAGSIIGLTFVLIGFFTTRCAYDVALKQQLVIPISALAGLCGSVIDSLLGATLQFSGFCSVRNKVSSTLFEIIMTR
ncbi:hypothetical protein TEA_000408 [Camellia sinensis var. sinensis]|uniref:Uncharacterized protein n=1 Tax=Camellia sinensis var. sinensis TaxID=542762 RepID=A0A4S4E736_CAMSN|nr:hypothetical protein TEA_000408 [Camellia sinensis var. sinensis]